MLHSVLSSLSMKQGNMPSELPPWMKFLHAKLSNPATPLNIRLFISKLIINTEEVNVLQYKFIQLLSLKINKCVDTIYLYVTPHTLLLWWSLCVHGFNLCCWSVQVFRPYAKHWLGPLLQVVVSGNNGGEGIHFMVVDIVVTVLSWTSLAGPKVANTYNLKTANINH